VATSSGAAAPTSKTSRQHTFRPRTPWQNANLLQHLATIDLSSRPDPEELSRTPDPQAVYDSFYASGLALLEEYYPERTTVTSRDPSYITPVIKARLRLKNRLMRAGRVDEAGALARQIGRDITRQSKRQLEKIGSNTNEQWKAVRQLVRQREPVACPGITADSLNRHYASMSNDDNYEQPPKKDTVAERPGWKHHVTDYQAFMILDTLQHTATGLDKLPTWFLRFAAPVLCGPVADIINLSLSTSTVPNQWKRACIRPVPKTPTHS